MEVNTGKEIATLGGHTRPLTEIAASPDGKWIATSSRDNSAQLWDATTGRKIWTLAAFAGAAEHFFDARATFSPNSKLIVTCCGSDDNGRTYKLILWDVTSGKKLAEAPYHLGSAATSGAVGWTFSPNGIRVLEVNQDGTARIREVLMGQIISTLQGMKNRSIGLFNSNGTWVSTLEPGTSYGDAELWDTNTGNKISVLPGHSNTGIGSSKLGGVKKVFYNSAGTRIVTLSGDNTAELWDPITGRQIALLHFVDNVVLSPDGSSLLSYGSGIQLWDMGTGKLLQTFSSSSSPGQLALFSPNGDRVLTINATYKVTSLWETGIEVAVMRGHTDPIYNTEFDTSGKRIVTASADGTARVWEVPTGR